jgi:hypothetical protein
MNFMFETRNKKARSRRIALAAIWLNVATFALLHLPFN